MFYKMCSLVFLYVFVTYINRNHKDTRDPLGRRMDTALNIYENASQVYQPEFLKIWRVWMFLFKKLGDFRLSRDI